MNESIILSEKSQLQKNTYCMILFIGKIQKRQTYREESRSFLDKPGGRDTREWLLMSTGFLLGVKKVFWSLDHGGGHMTL